MLKNYSPEKLFLMIWEKPIEEISRQIGEPEYAFDACLTALQIASPANQGQYRMRHTFTTLALDHTEMSDEKVAAIIGDRVETIRNHYQGHCMNRGRDEDDIDQLNALNHVDRSKFELVK